MSNNCLNSGSYSGDALSRETSAGRLTDTQIGGDRGVLWLSRSGSGNTSGTDGRDGGACGGWQRKPPPPTVWACGDGGASEGREGRVDGLRASRVAHRVPRVAGSIPVDGIWSPAVGTIVSRLQAIRRVVLGPGPRGVVVEAAGHACVSTRGLLTLRDGARGAPERVPSVSRWEFTGIRLVRVSPSHRPSSGLESSRSQREARSSSERERHIEGSAPPFARARRHADVRPVVSKDGFSFRIEIVLLL